jgi:glycosyltransferase involved in cell wall biosynthesis
MKASKEPATPRPPHLALMTTSALATIFFRGQIARLRRAGFRVSFICNPGPQTASVAAEGADVIPIPMERDIAVFSDLRALWKLWRTLRKIKPDIINVGTPKAGLLGGIAARMAGVPRRIYTLQGLRLETATGWKRRLLTLAERLACRNAQYVRCVSPSLRLKVIGLGLVDPAKAYVVSAGSSNGVDCQRFCPTPEKIAAAGELRRALGIPDSAPVIGFVGRFTRDKGISELCSAYQRLKPTFPDLRLLLVGDFEDGDPVDPAIRAQLENDEHVHLAGTVPDTAPYYLMMTALALPTYREGFPNAPLEAQAAGVPVVTTAATGARDSVLDGFTGCLVPPRDEYTLAAALKRLLRDPEERDRMGKAAEEWVRSRFEREIVWAGLISHYNGVLQGAIGTTPTQQVHLPVHARPALNHGRSNAKGVKLLIVATVHNFLEAFLLPFAQHYRALGWTVDGLARGAESSAACREAFDSAWEAKWSRTPLDLRGNLAGLNHVRELVQRVQYDIVHVHTPVASFLTRAALRRSIPNASLVYTAHGFHFFPGGPRHKNLFFRRLEKAAGRWTDALVVMNHADESAARSYRIVDDNRLFYMPGIGIDLQRYGPDAVSETEVNRLRHELGLCAEERVLLEVAEMIPRKRHEDTLRALAGDGVRVKLLLAGDGPSRADLQSLAASLGLQNRVAFLGPRRDIPALIKLADALILVSSQEGLPRSVMEAMAMSKPVIGSDIRGTRDLLAGGSGLLVPVGDISAIADAIRTVVENPSLALEMGRRGRESIRAYDLAYILKLHDQLYEQILAN